MTDEEIIAAIAEKVMGWKQREYQDVYSGNTLLCWTIKEQVDGEPFTGTSIASLDYNPLENDVWACEVLDRMVELGYNFRIRFLLGKGYDVYFARADGHPCPIMEASGTDRRRITCLAALNALGINITADVV